MLHNKMNQSKEQTFDRLYTYIRERKGLTNNDRVLFAYMLNKYEFFSKFNKPYKESQEELAEAVDVSLATLKRCLKTLTAEGLLEVVQNKGAGFTSYSTYVVKGATPQVKPKPTQVIKRVQYREEDDPDVPF
jgi:predicted transcriptional regulator